MGEDYRLHETRQEVRVETVETERVLCACCGQAYDEDEILTVGVEMNAAGDALAHRPLCEACAANVLDYEQHKRFHGYIQRVAWRRTLTDKLPGKDTLASVGVTLTVAAIVLWVGTRVMAAFEQAVEQESGEVALKQAAEQTTTSAEPVFGVIGFAMVVLVVVVAISMMAYGPRMT